MHRRWALLLAALLLPVGVAACGGGQGAETADGSALDADARDDATDADEAWPISTDVTESFCRPWAEWTCARVLACGCSTPTGGSPTEEACRTLAMDECAGNTAELAVAVAAGLAVVSVSDVAACLQSLEVAAGPCGAADQSAAGPACARQFAEPGDLGAACSQSPCAGGRGACVEATCVALSAEGGPCLHRAHCLEGDCVDGACRAFAPAGEACAEPTPACAPPATCIASRCALPVEAGGSCSGDAACQTPLACLGEVCAGFPAEQCTLGASCGQRGLCLGTLDIRCEAEGGAGAACVGDTGCRAGFSCVEGVCAASPGLDLPCSNGVGCTEALACRVEGDLAGTCGPLPGKGDACALDVDGPFVCGPGLACAADVFVCDEPPGDGEPCANPNRCATDDFDGDGKSPDLACDFTTDGSFCASRKKVGEPCQNDPICADGLYCDFHVGACAAAYPLGTSCSVGNECGAGAACLPDDEGDLACRPLPGVGETCLFDCQPGAWCHARASDLRCQPPVCQVMYQLH